MTVDTSRDSTAISTVTSGCSGRLSQLKIPDIFKFAIDKFQLQKHRSKIDKIFIFLRFIRKPGSSKRANSLRLLNFK